MTTVSIGRTLTRGLLWPANGEVVDVPGIGVTRDGTMVAVAGGAPGNGVRLYPTRDLLRGRMQARELRSRASRVKNAWFVRRDQQLGVAVRQSATDSSTVDSVFDASQGKFVPMQQEWVIDRPSLEGWTVSTARAEEM